MLYTNSECHKIATGFNKNKRAMQNVKKNIQNKKSAGENMSYRWQLAKKTQTKRTVQQNIKNLQDTKSEGEIMSHKQLLVGS